MYFSICVFMYTWYIDIIMIISLLQTKGGTGKTTLAKCLAYSGAFHKAFKSIGLVELDIQGTLKAWHTQRPATTREKDKVKFIHLSEASHASFKDKLKHVIERHDTVVLDVPGESVSKFATQLAISLSDIALFPMRSSTNDEQSFVDNILPVIGKVIETDPEKAGSYFIIPTFVHSQANPANVKNYFASIMPDVVGCLNSFLPTRGVFENYSRDGMSLFDYAKSVEHNKRANEQARKAIDDIEKIAKEILSLKQS